jgi:two-component system, LuxR family, sensor kinase FixL
MRLAASAADLSLWEWDIIRDEIWTTQKGRERAGIGASERIDFARYLQSVHPDDRELTQRAVRHALEVSGEYEAEYRVTARDRAARWVVARGPVERDAQGKPLRLRGVSVDVTERKQAEAELRRLQGEVAHVSRVSTMGQLSTALAHELNQPLGAILSNAEAAEMLLEADPPALGQVREILAWGYPSPARLSRPTTGTSGRRTIRTAERRFVLRCRRRRMREEARGTRGEERRKEGCDETDSVP